MSAAAALRRRSVVAARESLTEPTLSSRDRWATVSREADLWTSHYRHVVEKRTAVGDRRGWTTSLCGSTASHANIWRGNTSKPRCPTCVERLPT